jgi:isopentenyldiphosphate isomerase
MPEEILDLVDETDCVIGQISRDTAWATLARIRVVNAVVVNPQGQLWIPRRTAHKKMFPTRSSAMAQGRVLLATQDDLECLHGSL